MTRNVKASASAVGEIKDILSSASSEVKSDYANAKEWLAEDKTPDNRAPALRYNEAINQRRLTHKDIDRIIRRSATSAWVSFFGGALSLAAAIILLHPLYLAFTVALLASGLRHAFVNWMHRNRRLTTFKEFWQAPDFMPKRKR